MYKDFINRFKSRLDEYEKKTDESLKKLYDNARLESKKAYQSALNEAAKKFAADRERAYLDKVNADRNFDEFAASRGLVRSGENINAKIASGVSFNNTLKNIADSNALAQNAAAERYAKESAEINADQAQKSAENRKNILAFSADISKAAADHELKREQLDLANKEFELKKQAIEDKNENKPSDSKPQDGKPSLHPDISGKPLKPNSEILKVKEMAQTILGRFGTDGYLKNPYQSLKTAEFLNSLKSDGLPQSYLDSLEFNLKAAGYTGTGIDFDILSKRVEESEKNERRMEKDLLRVYLYGGSDKSKAALRAKQGAKEYRCEFLYKTSPTKEFFELAAYKSGLDAHDLGKFYAKVKKSMHDPLIEPIYLGSWL